MPPVGQTNQDDDYAKRPTIARSQMTEVMVAFFSSFTQTAVNGQHDLKHPRLWSAITMVMGLLNLGIERYLVWDDFEFLNLNQINKILIHRETLKPELTYKSLIPSALKARLGSGNVFKCTWGWTWAGQTKAPFDWEILCVDPCCHRRQKKEWGIQGQTVAEGF